MTDSREPVVRFAVRALLVDPLERVLLLRSQNPQTGLVFWFPPGGGIELGETAEQALARELFEETGLVEPNIVAELWHRRHVFAWRDDIWDQRERCFLVPVPEFTPDTSHANENELAEVSSWRWWSQQDLHESDVQFSPQDLPRRYSHLLLNGPPLTPEVLGDH
jgi:8-oxo-dGTP pyrophosphatase MutT (NUDIX family)